MESWTVSCGSCEDSWVRTGHWSAFEQEAVESRPCPCCGAYTLRGHEPRPAAKARRRSWAALDTARPMAGLVG